jgi:hypothetical protein
MVVLPLRPEPLRVWPNAMVPDATAVTVMVVAWMLAVKDAVEAVPLAMPTLQLD